MNDFYLSRDTAPNEGLNIDFEPKRFGIRAKRSDVRAKRSDIRAKRSDVEPFSDEMTEK